MIEHSPRRQFATLAAMIHAAMDETTYEQLQAAQLVVTWLEADAALVQQFGKELWRIGARQLCSQVTSHARSHTVGPATHVSSTRERDVPTTTPLRESQSPSLTPQRPTGLAHLGHARVIADARRLMEFQLGYGLPLWRADKKALRDQLAIYDKQIGPMILRRTWLALVVDALPNDRVTVGEVLDEAQLQHLYQRAEHHQQGVSPETEATPDAVASTQWLPLVVEALPNDQVTVGKVLDEERLRILDQQAQAQPNGNASGEEETKTALSPRYGMSPPPLTQKKRDRKTKSHLSPLKAVSPVSS